MPRPLLVIGNKNYSSWSLRPWIAMRVLKLDFQEVRIPLYGPGARQEILRYSPSGKVPCLVDGASRVWDSAAILEYLAEKPPLWPDGPAERAQARSVCREMHAGFPKLREHMSMDGRKRHPGRGRTPELLAEIDRREGFKPVGREFPVFLHPETHEEHALARTERKSGRGYKGFTVHAAPEVTLEDDLKRRDLTINAMAKAEDGTLIDPFGGRRDLKEGVLRHVSRAFAEDPVRILRVARFAARFGFRVADETMQLMKAMVNSGEADSLVPERVWQEFSRGLAEPHPERMFEVLEACGLRQQLLPELKAVPQKLTGSVPVRFALLAWPLKEAEVNALCERLRAPGEERELALLACRCRPALRAAHSASPQALLELLKRADAFRRPERFKDLLEVAGLADPAVDVARLRRALEAAAAVDAGAIAAKAGSQSEIPSLVDAARVHAIARAL